MRSATRPPPTVFPNLLSQGSVRSNISDPNMQSAQSMTG